MEWSKPEKLEAKCKAPASSAASSSPSTGKTCPERTLADKCNINCGNSKPQCTGENSGSIFTSKVNSFNGVNTFVSVIIAVIIIDKPANNYRPIKKL